ncbi:MAG: sigma-70 family RNA polymerase sigma factor [Acidobacteria bacterium]|nr:sigma-70 family RNA polymerase sigma factor [Acidobacteriota bacterium]
MASSSPQDVTELLVAWSAGDTEALARLIPLVEAELNRLARAYLRKFPSERTLQTTGLVNEAYVRLIDWRKVTWQNRAQFIGVAATLMRNVLIDRERRRKAKRHGGGVTHVSLVHAAFEPHPGVPAADPELMALHEALNELALLDSRQARIVVFSFFGGMTNEEIAYVLKIAERTVRRDLSAARAWLYHKLKKKPRR